VTSPTQPTPATPAPAGEPIVLRPLRHAAHKVLAVPVGLLVVGVLTASGFLTIVATCWTTVALVGVLLSRVVLEDTGVSVRPGLLGKRAAWPDVTAVYVETSGLRRRNVVCETATSLVRLPSPPGYFRSDERLLALQLALVDNYWKARRGKRWRPATRRVDKRAARRSDRGGNRRVSGRSAPR